MALLTLQQRIHCRAQVVGRTIRKRTMHQARQLRQEHRPLRRLVAEVAHEAAPADLLRHPALEIGFGRFPEIQVGIEVPAQAFDVEQGLLQQHQLRLDLDVETARSLEQAQQHFAEGNLLQGLVEDGLANCANRGFEFVHAGLRRDPAGFDVDLRHAPVVTPEKGEEILRQVILVHLGERAHDAEIQRDIAPVRRDENVAGVHVGMEETVAEHLGEKDLHAGARQFRDVDSLFAQFFDLAYRRAAHALHYHDLAAAIVPENLRHPQEGRTLEVAAQLAGVRRLAKQVEFVIEVLLELTDYFPWLEAAAILPQPLYQAGGHIEQRNVSDDDAGDPRPENLHRHFAPAGQDREMHLRHRGAGDRRRIEALEHRRSRLAVGTLQGLEHLRGRERRDLVLEFRQFVGNVERDKVAAGGQHLPELHEYRPECFQREAQAFSARPPEAAPEQQPRGQRAQPAHPGMAKEEFVQPEAQRDVHDLEQPQQVHDRAIAPRFLFFLSAARRPRQVLDALIHALHGIAQFVDLAHELGRL